MLQKFTKTIFLIKISSEEQNLNTPILVMQIKIVDLHAPIKSIQYKRKIIQISQFNICMEGKRTKQADGPQITETALLGIGFKFNGKPNFTKHRLELFKAIKKRIDGVYAEMEKPEISIKLKDGKEIPGKAFETTPFIIAKGISKHLAESSIVAKVKYFKKIENPLNKGLSSAQAEDAEPISNEYELFDMTRPLEGDCEIQFISFEDKLGKQVFWHSSAHLLGQSLENNYGAWLCHGPPLDNGFFYDSFMGPHKISQIDYDKIERQIKKYAHEKQPYERIVLTKKEALQMFAYNPFKKQLIEAKIPEQGLTSAYRCGDLIDLCTGPHIPSANYVKGFKVTKNSSAYWLGKKQNDDLQRVYAISFPKQSLLDEYLKIQDQLAKRDHRTIGPKQDLFHFTTLSPGSALFYPHGAVIYNRLMQLMRNQYKIRGYSEVISPNIYNSELWKISGHYFKYKDNIYWIRHEGEEFGLKPMNCPGHCVMFNMIQRSYKDLPIRYADFGVLHRNQLHGALSGLTRVRRFQQDDAHIFCMPDQIEDEILGVLDLLDYIYSVFGFKYNLELSTRPEQYLGDIKEWDKAQTQLQNALVKFGKQYKINEGDGAFYGPKIDVKLFDVFGREHQCGTVQLDFQLPQRFNLQFRSKANHEENEQEEKNEKKQKKEKKEKKEKKKVELTQEERQALRKQKQQRKKKEQEQKYNEMMGIQKEKKQDEQQLSVPRDDQSFISGLTEDMAKIQEKYGVIHPVKNGFQRPVIIHRAIFGSLERFIAILCEHTGGKWDFWVSPRQLKILPMAKDQFQYAEAVQNALMLQGFSVQTDKSADKLQKKVRNAQIESFNFMGVIGAKEVEDGTITLRKRDEQKPMGTFLISEVVKIFSEMKAPKSKRREAIQAKAYKL